ncbi:MAG: CpaF family protein, partial [Desulfuromonadales bacterium]|nr:CpaF family protein [Desulfuromonadales bacterium]
MAYSERSYEIPEATGESSTGRDEQFYNIKNQLHYQLVEEADLSALDILPEGEIRSEVTSLVEDFLRTENIPMNREEREHLIRELIDELTGLGPLEPLLRDPTVSDILCNTYRDVYVERAGRVEKTPVRFVNDAHLMNIIDRIISQIGRRIDESSPMVDARLPDGSRVNAIIPPLAVDGPMLSIRRFAVNPLKMEDLINYQTLTEEIGEFLA